MDIKFDIYRLSTKFYNDYPSAEYPELLSNKARPYTYLIIQCNKYIIAIPYRSEIKHNNTYLFKHSKRSRAHKSGLDYSKVVIITNMQYINTVPYTVDSDEYAETIRNIRKISQEITTYIEQYIEHVKIEHMSKSKFDRAYKYSTLKYFHRELGIDE